MNTYTQTTATAVSRALGKLELFDRFDGDHGYSVRMDFDSIMAYEFTYSKDMDSSPLRDALTASGFETAYSNKYTNGSGLTVESVWVKGKVSA